MKKTLKILTVLFVLAVFSSCTDDDECQGETTTFTLPDGTTRTTEQPCFDF